MSREGGHRKICIFTGARSEYGLLHPLMEEIRKDRDLELCILVSGMHLSPEFGMTFQEIEKDGFKIDEKVEILMSSDSVTGIAKSMGMGLMGYADALERLKPDVVILLGDRYETFCAAASAVLLNIPIAHIHGGELTYGAWDDAFRHAVTKMSLLHFTCAGEYEKRVIQMGEHPERVFNVGSLGVENVTRTKLPPKKEFYNFIGFDPDEAFLLVTFHPVTREGKKNEIYFISLLNALSDIRFGTYKLVFTKSNSDSYGRWMNQEIGRFVEDHPERSAVFDSMGQINYLNAMKYASAMVGNSSSGILEAACFELPVINIGNRQKGRLRAKNVIDCDPDRQKITEALEKGLNPLFRLSLKNMENPFQKESTARIIKDRIKQYNYPAQGEKEFFDLD